eukprot:275410_1
MSLSLEEVYPKINANDEKGDAELAAALQHMENQNQNQQVIQHQQQEMISHKYSINDNQPPQKAVVISDDSPVTGTKKHWYRESINNAQYNNCSCKCKDVSARNAAICWFILDFVHNCIHVFIWIVSGLEVHQNGAITFAVLWILIAFTNLFAILGTNDFLKIFIQIKLVAFPLSCILFWIEVAFVKSFMLYMVIPGVIAQFILTFFAMRDTWKIYKWIDYYKKGGPKSNMLP